MLLHSEKLYGWWRHCNYSYKIQIYVPQRFEIDLEIQDFQNSPGDDLDPSLTILSFSMNLLPRVGHLIIVFVFQKNLTYTILSIPQCSSQKISKYSIQYIMISRLSFIFKINDIFGHYQQRWADFQGYVEIIQCAKSIFLKLPVTFYDFVQLIVRFTYFQSGVYILSQNLIIATEHNQHANGKNFYNSPQFVCCAQWNI